MYHSTGLTQEQIVELYTRVNAATIEGASAFWPPVLGLFKSVVITLTYLRRNRVQAEIAETLGVSQPTISRAITGLTAVLGQVLADAVPVAEDLDLRTQYIADGTCCRAGHGTVSGSCTPASTLRHEAACCIPSLAGRNWRRHSWVRCLTWRRKVKGTAAWQETTGRVQA
jgi:hypothetical protein